MSDISCETIPSKEGYAMDWRGNSHDMDDLVVKIMKEGIKQKKYGKTIPKRNSLYNNLEEICFYFCLISVHKKQKTLHYWGLNFM